MSQAHAQHESETPMVKASSEGKVAEVAEKATEAAKATEQVGQAAEATESTKAAAEEPGKMESICNLMRQGYSPKQVVDRR